MISILTDTDLKRDDLKFVPIEHLELSDFSYYTDRDSVVIGKSRTILFIRDGLIKIFKHFVEFPNTIQPLDSLFDFL